MAAPFHENDGAHVTPGRSFFYRACGLSIQADAAIPGLYPCESSETADLQVRMLGSIGAPQVDDAGGAWYVSPYKNERDAPLLTIHAKGSSYIFRYAEGTQFRVSASGSQVEAWWDEPLSDADAADYLLSGVIAFVLRLRRVVPLHASAVVIGGRAVLFAGPAGAGKSSTAAAFAILGCPVLSDDLVAVASANDRVAAYPSSPRVSVWSDSARGLFATDALPMHSAVYSKHYVDLIEASRFHQSPAPIETIFILAPRTEAGRSPVIRSLTARQALVNLVGHTYGNYLLDASMRAREFDVLGRMVSRVEVSELALPSGLDGLVSSCRQLAEELAVQSHFPDD